MNKDEVIRVLIECGEILEISAASPFAVRAYSNGARALESWQGDLEALVKSGEITSIRGIGKGLAALIEELVIDGESDIEAEIRELVPESLLELLRERSVLSSPGRARRSSSGPAGRGSWARWLTAPSRKVAGLSA